MTVLVVAGCLSCGAPTSAPSNSAWDTALSAAGAAPATSYTSDPNIADFTAGITTYATLSNFYGGDVSSPFTPTSAEISSQGLRVYAGGSITGLPAYNNWILATFPSAVPQIRVFPNIDHFGASYDGYQYSIAGSNDGTTWTMLFDALTVDGAGEPFTLGTFTGTPPTTVNNVATCGCGPAGSVGYEADFNFGAAYLYYAFGASTVAFDQENSDQELSGVAGLCQPATSCPAGWNCGTAPDGCGGTINCGTCSASATCGGGGVPNVCGSPATGCAQSCGNGKMTICHIPPGEPSNRQTLCINPSAGPAHANHHDDYCGPCQ